MIFDRTMRDVIEAGKIRDSKIKNFIPLEENELITVERGMVTIRTLNRIESEQQKIKSLIVDMGYHVDDIENKSWTNDDVFLFDDLKRICDNNTKLRDSFFAYSSTPREAIPKYSYFEFNNIEKMLFDLSKMVDYVINSYRICGTFNCGE